MPKGIEIVGEVAFCRGCLNSGGPLKMRSSSQMWGRGRFFKGGMQRKLLKTEMGQIHRKETGKRKTR